MNEKLKIQIARLLNQSGIYHGSFTVVDGTLYHSKTVKTVEGTWDMKWIEITKPENYLCAVNVR